MVRSPTLTEVRRWSTGDLNTTASAWISTATLWQNAFTDLNESIGTAWRGSAAEGARVRVGNDRLEAVVRADHLYAAAAVARTGAERIGAARLALLQTVDAATMTGLIVGEDFTVSSENPARRGESRSVASALGARLDRLVNADRQVAVDMMAAAAGLGLELPSGGGIGQHPPELPAPGHSRSPEDPYAFGDWWKHLSDEEKDRLFAGDQSIGNHGGMPFAERDLYNRRHLDTLRAQAEADAGALQKRFDDLAARLYMGDHSSENTGDIHDLAPRLAEARRRLIGYESVRTALNHPDGVPRLLGLIDDDGHAAVSIGDPDTAIRTAVFVPGTGQDMSSIDDNGRRALDMFNAALVADPTLSKSDVAVTTWVGYDRPMTLTEAAWPDRARSGGAALDRYLDGMHASHSGPPAVDTVIGHSYGSTLVGAAATGGHHLAADNVIAVGSPGMLSRHAGELALDSSARVYSMTAGNDPISLVTSLTLGVDPNDVDYGAIRLVTDPGSALPFSGGLLPGVSAHSSYWDEGNPGLINMGAIIAGLPPAAVRR